MGPDATTPGAPARTATTRVVKGINRTAILDALREHGPLTRRDIGQRTGLSPATVERLTTAMVAEGLIAHDGHARSSGGRPSTMFRHVGEGRLVAAVEVGAQRVRGRLVDLDGRVVHESSDDAPADPDAEAAAGARVPSTLAMIAALLAAADRVGKPCVAVGVSVPGAVSTPDGRVTNAAELGWRDIALGEILRERYELPILVENDANATAIGESTDGVGAGARNLVAFVLGYGSGAGIISDGRVLRGHRAGAGEVGYLLADRTAFDRLFTLHGDLESRIDAAAGGTTLVDVLDAAARGGPAELVEVADEVFDYVALALAALSVVLDPEVIVLGGHLTRQPPVVVEELRRRLVGRIASPPRILVSALGADAALVGVAHLAIERARESTYLA